MPDDQRERLARLEGVFASTMPRIEEYMRTGTEMRNENSKQMGKIETSVSNFGKYQEKCDTERADHEKRITATEGFQGRLIKCAVAITGIGSLASPQLAKLWTRIFS